MKHKSQNLAPPISEEELDLYVFRPDPDEVWDILYEVLQRQNLVAVRYGPSIELREKV